MTFLEETFGSPQANPKHRLHQKAAQAVLKALLPETAPTSRARCGRKTSCATPSGYAGRPRDFDDLIAHPRPRAAADHADRSRRRE